MVTALSQQQQQEVSGSEKVIDQVFNYLTDP